MVTTFLGCYFPIVLGLAILIGIISSIYFGLLLDEMSARYPAEKYSLGHIMLPSIYWKFLKEAETLDDEKVRRLAVYFG